MIQTCEGEHYSCGNKEEWPISGQWDGSLSQRRNKKRFFMLGGTEIIVHESSRTFDIQYEGEWHLADGAYLMNNGDGFFDCSDPIYNHNHSVVESYQCKNTSLYFLDTRYNNAICKEVEETLTFSKSSNEMAGFKEAWGVFYYPKYVITNHILRTVTTYFVIVNGIKTILKTTTTTENINTSNNPLILVYPNPPSQAIPWINCDDIKKYGFYDYHAEGSQEQIRLDGGDDFYFTDWMRLIGVATRTQDQSDADTRYFEYYLGDEAGKTRTSSYDNPGISIDSTPAGSICRDKDGNVFYSMTLDGEVFNFITDGNLAELFPETGVKPQFYPVGLT